MEEKDMEHQANLLKMAENAESELRQKDIQLAMVEAEFIYARCKNGLRRRVLV